MAIFQCTTCGNYNYAADGQPYAVCTRCGTWFYIPQQPQNPFSYSPPTTYNHQQPQAPVSKPEPQEYIPKIPAGNRYAGHDKVLAKMAKDCADRVFRQIQAVQWRPVAKDTVVVKEDIFFLFGPNNFTATFGRCNVTIEFVNYGMRSLYTEHTPNSLAIIDAFKMAVEPALKYYLKEKAQEKLGNIHRLSSYKVDGGISRCLTNSNTLFMEFSITQTLHPDNLSSW